ncbi:hypothetical protein CBU02nite_29520 [Clostridium butyricum]|uniref:Uncharacterized protein n=1 Tax=Clostridium butyricum TaxID=1492 RepID=A0A512TQG7_CLOBU|nr:hypothetical protein [Clostridium butyricum]NOW22058.1 hypothetical protein [Clostridium butyricum]GEQ22446.1 hypothetical protein CBU02nite_29520 [Clostridium butyricum]
MIRSILNLITYLINDFKFLGFYGGFWFLSVPLITLVICAEKSKCEKDKLNIAEDFNDIDDIEELPLHSIEFKVNNTEKWQIGQVLKRMDYNTIDDLIKSLLSDIM